MSERSAEEIKAALLATATEMQVAHLIERTAKII
jgi:hypothetical protein